MADSSITPEAKKFLQLKMADGIGPILTQRLLERFGSIHDILEAPVRDFAVIEGIGRQRARGIAEARDPARAEDEIEKAKRFGVRIIGLTDAEYPTLLRKIADPPLCLYVRGKLQREDQLALAVVGSRKCSQYGHEQAYRFGAALATAGFTVVSGLARGIDAAAQRGAIEAGGRSIAVLGNGLATVYPPEHGELAVQIAARGAVISELSIDTASNAENFPARNRIIAGLSLGVLVVEASNRSGACITARLGIEYDREVFALPGRVDVASAHGSNALIRDGQAKLVTCLDDIIDDLGEIGRKLRGTRAPTLFDEPANAEDSLPSLDADEEAVWKVLTEEPADMDAIIEACGLPPERVSSAMTRLQLRSRVKGVSGRRFCRRGVCGDSERSR